MPRTLTFVLSVVLLVGALHAQSVQQQATVSGGGSGSGSTGTLGWTVGQAASATYADGTNAVTAGVQQPDGVLLAMNIRMLLAGPFAAGTGLMHDSLRVRALLPLEEPYTALGLGPVGLQPGRHMQPAVLSVEGPDAIVDWMMVELRSAADPSLVIAARAALLQRDGDLVDIDGGSPVRITALPGNYHVALRHRNHLPVMLHDPLALSNGLNTLDLSVAPVALHVPDAQVLRAGRYMLWPGDVNGNEAVQYTGGDNDRDPVLFVIGGTVPTNTATGYLPEDTSLDGTVKYTGPNNDRDIILQTIGGSVPTNVRAQPLP